MCSSALSQLLWPVEAHQLADRRRLCLRGPARGRRQRSRAPEFFDQVATACHDDRDLVFCDELGGPIHPNRLTERFARHREAAGIPAGTLHTLRHSAATLMLSSGIPVHIAAARLGDDPSTVLSTYAHLLPQSDELAAERVATAIT